MSSSLIVPVALIEKIEKHPKADRLELAQVLGWQCAVPIGQYKEGDKVVYISPDCILPLNYSNKLGVTQYLNKQRVKAIRPRGEKSFGIIADCENPKWEVGKNVADYYNITKYEPVVRQDNSSSTGKKKKPYNVPTFFKYTDIENLRYYPDIFTPDELTIVTEKIHGANSRIGYIRGKFVVGSHNVIRGVDTRLNRIWYKIRKLWRKKSDRVHQNETYFVPVNIYPGIKSLLRKLSVFGEIIIYGEIFGTGIQKGFNYGYTSPNYRAFDITINGKYLPYFVFKYFCELYDIPVVPELFIGRYGDLQIETLKLAEGSTTIVGDYPDNTIKEGFIVKPLDSSTNPRIGRKVLKYVSDNYYLLRENHEDIDTTDN